MHRLATIPGGWTPDLEGLITVHQSPAPLVFLTAADTEIQTLALAQRHLPSGFPEVRAVNLLQLQQQLTIDTYAETVLSQARLIILRLLGGRAYWPYGLEVVKEVVETTQAALIVLPGDDRPAPDLISHSTVPLGVANQFWRYLNEGGVDNLAHGLAWLSDRLLHTTYQPPPPQSIPRVGLYPWSQTRTRVNPTIGILFYRAHYLAGNTAPIDSLCSALSQRGYQPLPIYLSSLQEIEVQQELQQVLQAHQGIEVLLNTTSFALAKLAGPGPDLALWQTLDVPVLQVILSGDSQAVWRDRSLGLSPRDIAMNVALPEVDGRIITRAVSFKASSQRHSALETDVVTYQPVPDRIDFVADLAVAWANLRQTPARERRLALVLANYPNRDGRLANGVGLDTPQSAVEILQALQKAGYSLGQLPQDGNQLIQWLTAGFTPNLDGITPRLVRQSLSLAHYQAYFQALPEPVKTSILKRWGDPAPALGEATAFAIPGLQCGRVFLAIQPSRGYDLDPSLNYHCPDLEPPHPYLAVYFWLRHQFGAQGIIHLGKHGNLEWLPGKGVGLSSRCYPEVALGPLPHLYPFIVNNPGEGAQAKRRAQAVIIDHLTPPLTRAELYGPLQQLEALVDEYYEAQSLNPSRLSAIGNRLWNLLTTTHVFRGSTQTNP
jgi:cobaltochelatase CobN